MTRARGRELLDRRSRRLAGPRTWSAIGIVVVAAPTLACGWVVGDAFDFTAPSDAGTSPSSNSSGSFGTPAGDANAGGSTGAASDGGFTTDTGDGSVAIAADAGDGSSPAPEDGSDGASPHDASVAGDGAPPPSCRGGGTGLTDCGQPGSPESCCVTLDVEAGSFDRTSTSTDAGATGLADPASVSEFALDKYPVTVGRFRQYVGYLTSSAGAPPADGSGKHVHLYSGFGLLESGSAGVYESGWDAADWDSQIETTASAWNTALACGTGFAAWTPDFGPNEKLPINCVDWYEAYAFCIWDGGFLPSRAEWEYAAAGGSDQREYPWGSTDPGTQNLFAIYDCDYPSGSGVCGAMSLPPVGTAPEGTARWGQVDMAGEVDQWTLDESSGYVSPCVDCAATTPAFPFMRVAPGGAFDSQTLLTGTDQDPAARSVEIGVRCARVP